MAIVVSTHKYELVTALDYMCVPACLEMIIMTCDIKISQVTIAEHFGLNILPYYSGPIKNIKYISDKNMLGIVFNDESVNNFFHKFKIPLKETYVSIKTLEDWMFEDLVTEILNNGSHTICGFSYGYLYKEETKKEIGHISIIEKIDNRWLHIIDPGPLNAGRKMVEIADMFGAIHCKNDGVWIISKTN